MSYVSQPKQCPAASALSTSVGLLWIASYSDESQPGPIGKQRCVYLTNKQESLTKKRPLPIARGYAVGMEYALDRKCMLIEIIVRYG